MTAATKTGAPSVTLPLPAVTARDVELLGLVADGLSNVEIAARLGAPVDTVKSRLYKLGKRLGIGDRAGMVGAAYRRGILLPDPERAAVKPEPPPPPSTAAVSELDGLLLTVTVRLVRGAPPATLLPMARRAHAMALAAGRLK